MSLEKFLKEQKVIVLQNLLAQFENQMDNETEKSLWNPPIDYEKYYALAFEAHNKGDRKMFQDVKKIMGLSNNSNVWQFFSVYQAGRIDATKHWVKAIKKTLFEVEEK